MASYIPVLGTIKDIFWAIVVLTSSDYSNKQEKKELKIDGAYLALRATLALAPPLLLIVEGITTAVDSILR